MKNALDKLTIKGFKSIKSQEAFKLKNLNVLIGGNGAGKSNFIDLFRLLRAMIRLSLPGLHNVNLQSFISDDSGISDFLFNGPKVAEQIEIEVLFGDNGYRFKLPPTVDEKALVNDEEIYCKQPAPGWRRIGGGYAEPKLPDEKSEIYEAVESWRIHHFHDTGKTATMRRSERIEDRDFLRFDAANIAPFLLRLKEEESKSYKDIIDTIRLVTPFFDDFLLKPDKDEKVRLDWRQKGSDYPMRPHFFSDGTLRFICLVTALLQPEPPSTMLIDEPELGLHPYSIEILVELVQSVSKRTQFIVSTQSPALVDFFEPENIIVVSREQGASVFKRLSAVELAEWLEEYSMGDLWRKNVIGEVLFMSRVDV